MSLLSIRIPMEEWALPDDPNYGVFVVYAPREGLRTVTAPGMRPVVLRTGTPAQAFRPRRFAFAWLRRWIGAPLWRWEHVL